MVETVTLFERHCCSPLRKRHPELCIVANEALPEIPIIDRASVNEMNTKNG
jgi:hypothetical protein